jgi:Carbamoyl-phosphate synthase L chain, ATP binding domain
MAIAIVTRMSLSDWPYHKWLDDADEELHLFAPAVRVDPSEPALARFASVHRYEGMMTSLQPELDILELASRRPLTAVVAQMEWDIVRAADLRERLGLSGQDRESAVAYRDKLVMKDRLQACNLPVTPYRRVETLFDVLDHIGEHGYPVVVKPRRSAGASGVTVIETPAQLESLAAQGLAARVETLPDLLVESFVEGTQCIVDGLVADGRLRLIWPSYYLVDPSGFSAGTRDFSVVMFDVDHPLRARLQDVITRAVRALPSPRSFSFHAEVFHTPDDRLVIGEIACRTGGARTDDMVEKVFGVSLNRAAARCEAGLDPQAPDRGEEDAMRRAGVWGWVTFWPMEGELRRVPAAPDQPWVAGWRTDSKVGDQLSPPAHSGLSFASALVGGGSQPEVEARIHSFCEWFWANTEIAPAGEPAAVP